MPSASRRPPAKTAMTSIRVFRSYIKKYPDGTLDASGIISAECYRAWLSTRKQNTQFKEKAFQRALTGHLTGVDGRSPFLADEEQAILKVLRKRQRWPCFENSTTRYGEGGFRTEGFHERAALRGTKLEPEEEESTIKTPRKKRSKGSPNQKRKKRKSDEEEEDDGLSSTTPDQNAFFESEEDDGLIVSLSSSSSAAPGGGLIQSLVDNNSNVENAAMQQQQQHGKIDHVNYLLSAVSTCLKKLAGIAQWWSIVHGFVRMKLLARGWFISPTNQDAERVMHAMNRMYPNDYIILFDFTSQNYSDRIMLQNDLALRLFGGISRHHGGFKGKRFLPEDTWRLLKVIAHCFTYPGHEFPIQLPWVLNAAVVAKEDDEARQHSKQTALFDVTYYVDEKNHLLVERGRHAVVF